jgi:hypothetical protein
VTLRRDRYQPQADHGIIAVRNLNSQRPRPEAWTWAKRHQVLCWSELSRAPFELRESCPLRLGLAMGLAGALHRFIQPGAAAGATGCQGHLQSSPMKRPATGFPPLGCWALRGCSPPWWLHLRPVASLRMAAVPPPELPLGAPPTWGPVGTSHTQAPLASAVGGIGPARASRAATSPPALANLVASPTHGRGTSAFRQLRITRITSCYCGVSSLRTGVILAAVLQLMLGVVVLASAAQRSNYPPSAGTSSRSATAPSVTASLVRVFAGAFHIFAGLAGAYAAHQRRRKP